jgi:hypothetical protein
LTAARRGRARFHRQDRLLNGLFGLCERTSLGVNFSDLEENLGASHRGAPVRDNATPKLSLLNCPRGNGFRTDARRPRRQSEKPFPTFA